jgi:hypothetical protein
MDWASRHNAPAAIELTRQDTGRILQKRQSESVGGGMKMNRSAVCLAALIASSVAHANSPMVVDGAGRVLGYSWGDSRCYSGSLGVLSKTNYFACYRPNGIMDNSLMPIGATSNPVNGGLYYTATDCTSPPMVNVESVMVEGGFAFLNNYAGQFMAPPARKPYTTTAMAWTATGPCTTTSSPYTAVFMNVDPSVLAVTGFSLSPNQSPLTVQILPDTAIDDVIFFDGFDGAY